MIRIGEIEPDLAIVLDFPILMKLRSVVSGDRLECSRVAADQSPGFFVERPSSPILELADHKEACLSLDQSHNAIGRALAHHGIDFPVPTVPPAFDALGTFGNMPFPSHAAPAVIGPVALSAQLRGLTEVGP